MKDLASMLAGEEFSVRPVSMCPVIAAFLRRHNDSTDDERRQDLYAYAAKVVASRSPGPVQAASGGQEPAAGSCRRLCPTKAQSQAVGSM